MDAKLNYSECELRYIDQGYDLARAAETCAEGEERPSEKQTEKSNQEESWEDYWGDF